MSTSGRANKGQLEEVRHPTASHDESMVYESNGVVCGQLVLAKFEGKALFTFTSSSLLTVLVKEMMVIRFKR